MLSEERFKEICREEGANEAAVEEYWQFQRRFHEEFPNEGDSKEAARFTIWAMLEHYPEDRRKED